MSFGDGEMHDWITDIGAQWEGIPAMSIAVCEACKGSGVTGALSSDVFVEICTSIREAT